MSLVKSTAGHTTHVHVAAHVAVTTAIQYSFLLFTALQLNIPQQMLVNFKEHRCNQHCTHLVMGLNSTRVICLVSFFHRTRESTDKYSANTHRCKG